MTFSARETVARGGDLHFESRPKFPASHDGAADRSNATVVEFDPTHRAAGLETSLNGRTGIDVVLHLAVDGVDLIADRSDVIDRLVGRVGELPIDVALAGVEPAFSTSRPRSTPESP